MSEPNSADVETELNVKPTEELQKSIASDLQQEDGDIQEILSKAEVEEETEETEEINE